MAPTGRKPWDRHKVQNKLKGPHLPGPLGMPGCFRFHAERRLLEEGQLCCLFHPVANATLNKISGHNINRFINNHSWIMTLEIRLRWS